MDQEQSISSASEQTPFSNPELTQGEAIESATPENGLVQNSIAMSVSAGHDASIEQSVVLGGVVAGNDLKISDSVGGAFVAGNDLQLEDSGSLVAVVGGDTNAKDSIIGLLVASGDTNLDGDSKVLMTSQQALIFGAAAGAVFAILSLLFGRARK